MPHWPEYSQATEALPVHTRNQWQAVTVPYRTIAIWRGDQNRLGVQMIHHFGVQATNDMAGDSGSSCTQVFPTSITINRCGDNRHVSVCRFHGRTSDAAVRSSKLSLTTSFQHGSYSASNPTGPKPLPIPVALYLRPCSWTSFQQHSVGENANHYIGWDCSISLSPKWPSFKPQNDISLNPKYPSMPGWQHLPAMKKYTDRLCRSVHAGGARQVQGGLMLTRTWYNLMMSKNSHFRVACSTG